MSTLAGWLANSTIPWLKNLLIRYFVWRYKVNMEEAEQSDPFQYPSYNAFFTRTLKASCRPLAQQPHDLISPVDGYVGESGFIENAQIIQAKGHYFSVDELLGVSLEPDRMHSKKHPTHLEKTLAYERKKRAMIASHFKQGSFITLYLAPHNYHRSYAL